MARAWKRSTDKGKPGTPWQLTYTDWRLVKGKWRAWERSRTGYTDKRETLALGTQLEDKARMRRDGRIDDREDRRALEARRPIDEHIDDYRNSLQAKGSNEKHVAQSIGYIREIVTALDWGSIGALRADSLLKHLNDRITKLGQSPRTFNAWLVALKGFSHWLVLHDRLATDPLVSAKKIRQSADVRRKRRALSNIETEFLIHSTNSGPDCHFRRRHTKHTLTGPDRAMLYQVLLCTGLRLGEVASLTAKSIDLDAKDGPVIIVEAAYSKRRRRDEQPIPEPLAAALRPWMATKPQDRPSLAAALQGG